MALETLWIPVVIALAVVGLVVVLVRWVVRSNRKGARLEQRERDREAALDAEREVAGDVDPRPVPRSRVREFVERLWPGRRGSR